MTYTVEHFRPTDPAEAAEFDHFSRLLPALRDTHPGDYVAVCGGAVIARGPTLDSVYRTGSGLAAGRGVYVGWIDPPGGVEVRFGGLTVMEDEAS